MDRKKGKVPDKRLTFGIILTGWGVSPLSLKLVQTTGVHEALVHLFSAGLLHRRSVPGSESEMWWGRLVLYSSSWKEMGELREGN